MARALKKEDFVYDFLYVDARRLAVFMSQFGQYGHLTSLTRSVTEAESSAGGMAYVVKLETSESAQRTQASQFDTQWVTPLSFLDQAHARGLMKRDSLATARIGELHLLSGALAIFDLSTMKVLWSIPFVKKALAAALGEPEGALPTASSLNRKGRRAEKALHKQSSMTDDGVEATFQLLESLPHSLVASMNDGTHSVWATLSEGSLIVSPSDLMMKHGAEVAGTWRVVGVIDALPEDAEEESNSASGAGKVTEALGALGSLIDSLVPHVQKMLGRPTASFGITPLLIFREVLV